MGILFFASFLFDGSLASASMQWYLGIPKRVPIDLSHLSLAPSGKTKEIIATLESLGFHRLGEATVRLPFVRSKPIWILVSSDNSIQVETVYNRVSFSTFFDDTVLVVTDYPNGEHFQTPTYQCRTITTSIKDALDYHRLQVEKFRATYGSPRQVLSMADYIRWEVMGRVTYAGMRLKRFFRAAIAELVLSVFGITSLALAFLLSWRL